MKRLKDALTRSLPWVTAAWFVVELASLRFGLLDQFFFDATHADVQGIDYYSLPKAFLNLSMGRSAYATFDAPLYGSHATWFLSHPALALWLGSWLSFFEPPASYAVYTVLSVGMMAASAWLLARLSNDSLTRRLIWLLVLGSFPTYWMFYVGNVQAILVLALSMLFGGFFLLTRRENGSRLVFAGLLLSLFTKPVVLVMMPLLLLLRQTRRTAALSLAVYAVVSFLFEVVPVLNPEAIGWKQVLWLLANPGVVRSTMNIYANHFVLNAAMRDNSIHWFNLIAQSGMRLAHIDVFSLPLFMDTLTGGHIADWVFQLPTVCVLLLAVLVARLRNADLQMEAALLLLMATSVVFFLGYPTVWEYQYTSLLPVVCTLMVPGRHATHYEKLRPLMIGIGAFTALPSLYWLVANRPVSSTVMLVIWMDRVVPATLLFLVMIVAVVRLLWRANRRAGQGSSGQALIAKSVAG